MFEIEPNHPRFELVLTRLKKYRLIRHNSQTETYTTHPIIRNNYHKILDKLPDSNVIHDKIKTYYLSNVGEMPEFPTLDDLKVLIEVVHQACCAKNYDEAWYFVWEHIYRTDEYRVLVLQLGAWEVAFKMLLDFFPYNDISKNPQINDLWANSWVLNEVALCLHKLGVLNYQISSLYLRSIKLIEHTDKYGDMSISYQNLVDLYYNQGKLKSSAEAAEQSLILARRAKNKEYEKFSLGYIGWVSYLRGDIKSASQAFQEAEILHQEIMPGEKFLRSLDGIQHATYLRRIGLLSYAYEITESNLIVCKNHHWEQWEAQCYCVLGDLKSEINEHDNAQKFYDTSVKMAYNMSTRDILIEALFARGIWYAKRGNVFQSRNDLSQALKHAIDGMYPIYEADVRVGLSWMYYAEGKIEMARMQAEHAKSMSEEMGYYWGQVDAKEILEKLQ